MFKQIFSKLNWFSRKSENIPETIIDKVKTNISEIIGNRDELEKLFLIEKRRRGVKEDKLIFIGMANVAGYYWCAMKSLFENKKNELVFFASYLEDRILYSFNLGFIDKLTGSKEKLLEIGEKITFDDIERLLRERSKEDQNSKVNISLDAETITDEHGNKVMVINPDLSLDEKLYCEKQAKVEGIPVRSPEEFPLIRGKLLETTRKEKYPTIRWNFNWNDYVVVGVPDGITESFVYEFKTTRNKFLMSYLKPVALLQADLYGYFFRRKEKRVQIYIVEEKTTKTLNEQVNSKKVINVLENFNKIDNGWMPIPPKQWKCKSCEFKEICQLTK